MNGLDSPSRPALRGATLALLAAALFGVSAPLIQRFGAGLGPFATAALLYLGAAVVGVGMRQTVDREARLLRSDWPRLLAMAAAGAIAGPVALAWGLQRTSATSASLMLTLEALFTAMLAWLLYREAIGRRVWTAMFLLVVGGVLLIFDQSRDSGSHLLGLLAVVLATAAWGLDNTLSRTLAQRDPAQVVMTKALLGTLATSVLAIAFGEPVPSITAALALLAVGAVGYGLSLRFYLLAQRAFGAARTGSVFAFAPFIGAALAVGMGDHSVGWLMALEGLVIVLTAAAVRGRSLFTQARPVLLRGLLAGLLGLVAYGLVLWAQTRGALAPVAALRETSVIFAAFLGAQVLREGSVARRVAAAGAVVFGVVLMRF